MKMLALLEWAADQPKLAGAIALLALAYFLTHIHAVTGPNGMVIYNTITGQERIASP